MSQRFLPSSICSRTSFVPGRYVSGWLSRMLVFHSSGFRGLTCTMTSLLSVSSLLVTVMVTLSVHRNVVSATWPVLRALGLPDWPSGHASFATCAKTAWSSAEAPCDAGFSSGSAGAAENVHVYLRQCPVER